ncbi:MAG TPA: PhoH family protein [Candidatus Dormibacteraeota bacterium]|nr:PhoH family protein [Candidatus Dormibacteraeota bacterium]
MTEKLHVIDLELSDTNEALALFGANDKNLKQLEQHLNVKIVTRGEQVRVSGTDQHITVVEEVLQSLLSVIKKGLSISERDLLYAVELAQSGRIGELETLFEEEITKNAKGKPIRIKTLGQRNYVQKMMNKDVTFGIGPAGTGKTYLAVVLAVRALRDGRVKKIILTRPAVEAGESLGFLPGDLKEKVDPYLRPLYDALHEVLGTEHTARLIEREIIEIAPLAYMRGRTLDDAFVILDEAQNTTPEQMKMFLTRLGFGSKMVVTGDITQIDLPKGVKSGLKEAQQILMNVKGLSFIYLDQTDVVRHPLVQRIIHAYESTN